MSTLDWEDSTSTSLISLKEVLVRLAKEFQAFAPTNFWDNKVPIEFLQTVEPPLKDQAKLSVLDVRISREG